MVHSILVKFGENDNLEKLQAGQIYMKNLKYYNDLEKKTKKQGIGDIHDGNFYQKNARFSAYSIDNKDLIFSGTCAFELNCGFNFNPVFCMFSIDDRNTNKLFSSSDTLCYEFNNEQKELITQDLPDQALVFTEPLELKNRINSFLDKNGIDYIWRMVQYYNPQVLSIDRSDALKNGDNIVFYKKKNHLLISKSIDCF